MRQRSSGRRTPLPPSSSAAPLAYCRWVCGGKAGGSESEDRIARRRVWLWCVRCGWGGVAAAPDLARSHTRRSVVGYPARTTAINRPIRRHAHTCRFTRPCTPADPSSVRPSVRPSVPTSVSAASWSRVSLVPAAAGAGAGAGRVVTVSSSSSSSRSRFEARTWAR